MKCLIADPSVTQRRAIRNILQESGWEEIAETPDGKQALELCLTGGFDLLVTEWNLPGSTGIELVGALRENEATAKLPILMVTDRNGRQDVLDAVRAGVSAYLLKPFSAETLTGKIRQIVSPEGNEDKEAA